MSRKCFQILCLQGFRQTGEQFQNQTRILQECLAKECKFHFINSPHQIPINNENCSSSNTFPSWWHTIKNPDTNGYRYKGLKETLYYINQFISNNPIFDGILGFSQGGVLCGILLALMHNPDYAFHEMKLDSNKFDINLLKKHIRFSWINAGFIARDETILNLFLRMSDEHEGGHCIPADDDSVQRYTKHF